MKHDQHRWSARPHSIQIIPLIWIFATKPQHETLVTRLYVSNLIKQIIMFSGNSNFAFFFNFRKKKIGFCKLSFRFFYFNSIPRTPTPIPRIPTPIPCIPTQIPRIPTPIPCIPTPIPCIRIPIPHILLIFFSDSPFRFLQIATISLVPLKSLFCL